MKIPVHPFFSALFLSLWLWGGFAWGADPQAPLRPGAPEWGIYQIYWGLNSYRQNLTRELKLLGSSRRRPPKYVMFFRDLYRPFPRDVIAFNDSLGLTTIISLELTKWSRHQKSGPDYLGHINAGAFDSFFTQWARDAARYQKPVILRFGFEMNGNWFDWGGRPEEFTAAWRRVRKIFALQKADQVQWMFSPNVLWADKNFAKDLAPYYPGGEYVDLVGLDGYNFGDDSKPYHSWQSYSDVFGATLDHVQKWNHPVYLSEIGCAHDPRKAQWTREFLQELEADKRVHGFIWFNFDKRAEGEQNWRLDSDPQTWEAFNQWLTVE